MALQKSITLETGITLPSAYIRITEVMLSYGQNRAWVTVSTFADQSARDAGLNPVRVEEFRVFDTNGQEQVQAECKVNVNAVVEGSSDNISIDVNGDGASDVVLVEGVDFLADGTVATATTGIVEALNKSAVFNVDFTASSVVEGEITIVAKADGQYKGVAGNNLSVSGNAIVSQYRTVGGNDYVPSDFDKFFNLGDMNAEGINAIGQAYTFIKSLPQFVDCADC